MGSGCSTVSIGLGRPKLACVDMLMSDFKSGLSEFKPSDHKVEFSYNKHSKIWHNFSGLSMYEATLIRPAHELPGPEIDKFLGRLKFRTPQQQLDLQTALNDKRLFQRWNLVVVHDVNPLVFQARIAEWTLTHQATGQWEQHYLRPIGIISDLQMILFERVTGVEFKYVPAVKGFQPVS